MKEHDLSEDILAKLKEGIAASHAYAAEHDHIEQNDELPLDGFVYALRLDGEVFPGTVRVGWTSSIAHRLLAYQALHPNARMARSWPATSELHDVALRIAHRHSAHRNGEGFVDGAGVVIALDKFFELIGVATSS